MQIDEWSQSNLAEVADKKIVYGIVQAGAQDDEGIPYIKSSDVGQSIQPQGLSKTALAIHQKYHRSTVHPGDIVFSLRGNTGATSIVPADLTEANLTQGTARIAVSAEFDNRFVRYVLASDIAMRQVLAVAKGSTFTEVSLDALRKITIPHPPLPEQRKIADILSTWDQAIEKTEALLSNARTQKRSLMQQLLTGKRRFPAFEGQPWNEVRLGDVCKLQTGPFGSQLKANEYSSTQEGVAIVMPKALIGGVVIFADCDFISEDRAVDLNKHHVTAGDVLFSRRGDVARTALVTDDHQPAICGTGCLRARPTSVSIGRFLAILFQTEACRNWLIDNAVGQTMLNLNTKIIAALPIQLPCEAEQAKIVSVLEASDAEIVEHEKLVDQLRTEKKALMQQMLTGKRRVKVEDHHGV